MDCQTTRWSQGHFVGSEQRDITYCNNCFQFLIYLLSATAASYVNAGYERVQEVRARGQNAVLPKWLEVNLMKLVLACSNRGDRNAGDLKARAAVGHYIKGTSYEAEFKSKYPGSWNQSEKIVIPGMCTACHMTVTCIHMTAHMFFVFVCESHM